MPFLDRLAHGFLSPRSLFHPLPDPLSVPESEDPLRVCAAAGCTNGWMKPWKSHRRPIFEDAWGCSGTCLQKIIGTSVRREMGSGDFAAEQTHQHRIPLGLVLLAQGWITHPQLQHALAAQRAKGQGRIGDLLQEHCGLPEERIARGLGVQWNCPVLSLESFSPRAMALMMPKRFVAEFGMVPLRIAGSSVLYAAFQQKMNASAAFGLEQISGLRVECGLLPSTQYESAMARILAAESVPAEHHTIADADAVTAFIARVLEQTQPVASRLVRVHEYFWLRMWKEEDALISRRAAPMRVEDIEDHLFTLPTTTS